jgi:AraC-like DNA-binding protein
MQYEEFPAAPALAAVVDRLWTLSGDAATLGTDTQPVLPDGRPELILHFGDAFERVHHDGRVERQPALIFAGQLTSQLLLRPTGAIGVLGVRFHPYGAAALFNTPQDQLAGLTIGVEEIAPALKTALDEIRAATTDLPEAVALVQQMLPQWIDPDRIDARVRSAVEMIAGSLGLMSIDDIAARVSVTRRHLERTFLKTVGVTPKRLARITRFQHALRTLEECESASPGTRTAVTCGYADQAHFIRDFRDLAGCPPGEHLLRRFELTGLFYDNGVKLEATSVR